MTQIIRHYKLDEKPIIFDRLSVDNFFITEVQLQFLDGLAAMNIKISSEYAINLNTGKRFKLAKHILVYKGSWLNDYWLSD